MGLDVKVLVLSNAYPNAPGLGFGAKLRLNRHQLSVEKTEEAFYYCASCAAKFGFRGSGRKWLVEFLRVSLLIAWRRVSSVLRSKK